MGGAGLPEEEKPPEAVRGQFKWGTQAHSQSGQEPSRGGPHHLRISVYLLVHLNRTDKRLFHTWHRPELFISRLK